MEIDPNALVIRTSSFFGPWDEYNFAYQVLKNLKDQKKITVAEDVFISPTYVPDLVNECLDLLLDNESGIVHLTNYGTISWADFARKIAAMGGLDTELIQAVPVKHMPFTAPRPKNSALQSEKGILLPPIQNALERFFESLGENYQSNLKAG